MRKYGVFNTLTGLTDRVDTVDQAIDALGSIVADNVMMIRGRCPITVIDIAEDGTETWSNGDGIEVQSDAVRIKAEEAIRTKYSWAI